MLTYTQKSIIWQGECSVTGDMYFQSFDGRVYTFPATCRYVLAKSRNPGGFIVTIQNTPCGPNLDGTCIQSVSLLLNEDPRTEVMLSHSGEVYMASQIRITLPYFDASYAIEKCDILMQEVFAVCHEYVSPMAFQLQCHADVCRCGTPCLCSALAHYTRTCRKYNIIIEFRTHVPECGKYM
ncbi:otogelin [Silurus meridionalis]|nr:otogelin [Silurus meridionalis]